MDALVALGQKVAVEGGDVRKAGHPFRTLSEAGEVELVDDAGGAVAAAGAEDGPDSRVVELLLEVDDVPRDDDTGGDATALVLTMARELEVELEALTPHDPKSNWQPASQ